MYKGFYTSGYKADKVHLKIIFSQPIIVASLQKTVNSAATPIQLNCTLLLSYDTVEKETENSLGSQLYWFIHYCLLFMIYRKSDGVSHNTATGFLNQADRLIIEPWKKRQPSMVECTIPDPRGGNITQFSLTERSCSSRTTSTHNFNNKVHHSYWRRSFGLTKIEFQASRWRSVIIKKCKRQWE